MKPLTILTPDKVDELYGKTIHFSVMTDEKRSVHGTFEVGEIVNDELLTVDDLVTGISVNENGELVYLGGEYSIFYEL